MDSDGCDFAQRNMRLQLKPHIGRIYASNPLFPPIQYSKSYAVVHLCLIPEVSGYCQKHRNRDKYKLPHYRKRKKWEIYRVHFYDPVQELRSYFQLIKSF